MQQDLHLRSVEQKLGSVLEPSEQVQWCAKPNPIPSVLLTLPLLIFSIIWLSFCIRMMLTGLGVSGDDGFDLPLVLFLIPFILIGVALFSTPFWAWRKATSTIYAITDKRAIIYTPKKTQSFTGDELLQIRESSLIPGFGSVRFGKGKRVHSKNGTTTKYSGFSGIKDIETPAAMLNGLIGVAAESKPAEATATSENTPKPDYAAFNFARPPRHIPFPNLVWLFSGPVSLIGWIFFGAGMAAVWGLTCNADLTSWYEFRGKVTTVQGQVTGSYKTNIAAGGSDHSDGTPIYGTHYKFTSQDDAEYSNTSYAKGRSLARGKKVTVEYPEGKPQRARIKGMARKPVGLLGLIPVIFSVAGLCLILPGFFKGFKRKRLLKYGQIAPGKLIDKEETNVKINDNPVYKLTFEFNTPDGMTHMVMAKTHETEKLTDQPWEAVVYEPVEPDCAVLLDNLPGKPEFDEFGQMKPKPLTGALIGIGIPVAILTGHCVYAYIRFLK